MEKYICYSRQQADVTNMRYAPQGIVRASETEIFITSLEREQMLTIHARHPSGFAVTVAVPSLDAVDAMIACLQQQGYRPALTGDGWPRTPDGLPLCPKHGAVMTKREKQGDAWHSIA
jgi:hypothetical protein